MPILAVYLIVIALAASWWLAYTPPLVAAIYGCISLIAFALYAWDKSAARRGARRIPENTLHLLSLLGGWPGAVLAQQRLRHKTVKRSFRLMFWFTVLANCAVLGWLHTDRAGLYLNTGVFGLEGIVRDVLPGSTIKRWLLGLLAFRASAW